MLVEKASNSGFACVRDFLRSGLQEPIVTLPAPSKGDAHSYECTTAPQNVRLVRHVASIGEVRVLMANLLNTQRFPAADFIDLYHQRWRIEETFKRLKHRLNLQYVSGLSKLAAMPDLAAKIICDNLQAVTSAAAIEQLPVVSTRRVNLSYAHTALKPLKPALLLRCGEVAGMLLDAMPLIARKTSFHKKRKS